MNRLKRIKVGDYLDKNNCPKCIQINRVKYFLVYSNEYGFKLLSSECPHMGGKVILNEDCLVCPVHFWKFDHSTGNSININDQQLNEIPLIIEDNNILVYQKDLLESQNEKKNLNDQWVSGLTCKLHAHACIEYSYKGVSFITDPWLSGAAFLGSWYHYPKVKTQPEDIKVDFIVITHEHSDHFHVPTLKRINRKIPIIIPNFPNQRMHKILKEIGFKVILIDFGEKISLSDRIYVTCYEPKGLWNDSIQLIEFDSFKWLNLNDAGINQSLVKKIFPVDVVSSTFSFGASGYPLTWSSVSKKDAYKFMINSNNGRIEQIKHAMDIYGAKYFVPFASHMTLCHPTQIQLLNTIQRNNVFDIRDQLKAESFKVIDWFPGDQWDVEKLKIIREEKYTRSDYSKERLIEYSKKEFNQNTFNDLVKEVTEDFEKSKVKEYFLNYNNCPQIKYCEDVKVNINLTDMQYNKKYHFQIKVENGVMSYHDQGDIEDIHLLIDIPLIIFNQIINNDLSWDEAFVGYWCRFYRYLDEYKVGFWRMLQAPYYKKYDNTHQTELDIQNKPIEEIIQYYGDAAVRVLNRFGLYCDGCQFSYSENLMQAMDKHGLSKMQKKQLVNEITY